MNILTFDEQKLEIENKINETMNHFVKSVFLDKGMSIPSKVELFTDVEHESDGTSYTYFSGIAIEGTEEHEMCDAVREKIEYHFLMDGIKNFSWIPESA